MDPPMPAAQGNDVPCGTHGGVEDDESQRLLDHGEETPGAVHSACTGPGGADVGESVEPAGPAGPPRVSPYSVIDIAPFQEDPGPQAVEEEGAGPHVPSGYSVPVPCGYAVPSSLPVLLPAYSSPVLVRPAAPDGEAETPEVADDSQCNSLSSEDPASSGDPACTGDSALAHWAADPANTAWMDNPEEAIYDDVPRENSDSEPGLVLSGSSLRGSAVAAFSRV